MPTEALKQRLEALYQTWHDPRFLGTDPLLLVHEARTEDREVVAFLASCFALGRASLARDACRAVLERVGPPVAKRLQETPAGRWHDALQGFTYRFFSAARVANLLGVLGELLRTQGTLEAAWRSTGAQGWAALDAFSALFHRPGVDLGILVPLAGSQGASKRLNLFLRWMVRRDKVDPGTWAALTPAELFAPVDTHVLQWARAQGLTTRTVADRRTCLEITQALAALCPEDPLRYDFCITRSGMELKNTLGNTGLLGVAPL